MTAVEPRARCTRCNESVRVTETSVSGTFGFECVHCGNDDLRYPN